MLLPTPINNSFLPAAEPEIRDLANPILDEYIIRFQIPVRNLVLVQILHPGHDLFQDGQRLGLGETGFFQEEFAQVPGGAVGQNDV